MPITHDALTIHFGPSTVGAPDALEQPIIDFIDGAEKELRIAIQEVDRTSIAEAIARAKRRGVSTKVVMENDYLVEGKPVQPGRTGALQHNRDLLDAMLSSAVDVKSDFNPKIFHQKFIVRDREAVLTGSTNFTTTGVTKNLNHLIVIEHKDIAMEYWREFREISRGVFGKHSDAHNRKPKEHDLGGVRVKPLFAPEHSPEMEFMKSMAKARERIDFAIFTFAESSGIDDELISARLRGIPVTGAFDRKMANAKWAATHGLAAAGVTMHRLATGAAGGGARKIHHKLMVIDDRLVIGGSFNYTGPANLTNDENIVVIGDLSETDPAKVAAQKNIAVAVREEIDRIIAEHCEPFTPVMPD